MRRSRSPSPISAAAPLGANISAIVTNDLARSGLFRPIDRAAFIQSGPSDSGTPNFENWKPTGAQALVTGQAFDDGATVRVEFRLWDILPGTQIQGTAFTAPKANWRRVAHIMADAIYQRLLGEKGYFDTRIVYVSSQGPKARRIRRLAIMDQDSENQRYLTDGTWMVLTPRFNPKRNEIVYMSYANNQPRVYAMNVATGAQSSLGRFDTMTFSPRYSPDGGTVVMATTDGGGSDIIAVSGGSVRRLTNSGAIDVSPCLQSGRLADRVRLRPRRRPADLHHGRGWRQRAADQLWQRTLRHAGVVAARRPDRVHPLRRRYLELFDRRDAAGRLGRAHPGRRLAGRGADLRAERPRADVLARDARRCAEATGYSARLLFDRRDRASMSSRRRRRPMPPIRPGRRWAT